MTLFHWLNLSKTLSWLVHTMVAMSERLSEQALRGERNASSTSPTNSPFHRKLACAPSSSSHSSSSSSSRRQQICFSRWPRTSSSSSSSSPSVNSSDFYHQPPLHNHHPTHHHHRQSHSESSSCHLSSFVLDFGKRRPRRRCLLRRRDRVDRRFQRVNSTSGELRNLILLRRRWIGWKTTTSSRR